MNLQQPNANDATRTTNRSRSVVPMSGLCTRCLDGCRGNCEVFKATFRGRELIYPGPFGEVTAGGDKDYPIDYSHLNIQGYALGAKGLPSGVIGDPDTATFPGVNTETEYGWDIKVKMRVPIFTGALGSTEIARKNWEHFAIGAAISGVTLVCGENVCGTDPQLELDSNGKTIKAPDMDRRIETYRRYHQGYGEILVQMNVEDTRLGVAEYVSKKHGLNTIELKWGQGAKCIGGEIKVNSLERALELQKRGYIVTPDPSNPTNQAAFKSGAIKEFERHSRLGFIDEEGFYAEVQRLKNIGFKRITLKTGAYGLRELAMAIKWSSKAKIDLLTIDGAPGGTGMSPWRMMEEWGMPSLYLHAATYEFCKKLSDKGERVPDIAFAGGFSSEDGVFKALALGAPFTKAVCMGRALMIPGMVGKNIAKWIKEKDLPKTVSEFGSTPEEIFVCYEEVADLVGKKEMDKIPLGALGIYSYGQKIKVGLQQLMAGARCFSMPAITRRELMSLTEECAKVTGIPYLMDAYREEALAILDA
ncbi:MAG: FMN-binding glutamate synthase family protein [Deltaproteobacteria bacterium CG12_big_fil_rev_8_21_14_0_65_43_10]|nr:MAG: FMN-binding glutamate synthase family protein [Deltaproteobacteria bacterium CG2_30_43_15]PIQ45701.1 MAG: FMN-binding glutamate synthase family protein [Deltaproteobacteria bacterium CG12_big_fil_rev_8_21_14_0_65_43_10]PIU84767.1 MAG: FMN-binding glutamate synthase family protein [Deltaproteobacteria bacterium CG06_land_8_20_14_3_00_44_19]PIX24630.1 MAG: FMN-binding glutamate synthase family protein [Deltaproteobacteria bacterium CG_4_8_14_3_um_filter_43_13]PIZ19881.1 MAG: FMN-binding g